MKPFSWLKLFLCVVLGIIGLSTWGNITDVALADETSPHWSYGGEANPTQWGLLGHDFALCEIGEEQSPINIENAVVGDPAQLTFHYTATPLVVVNNGHTIQVNYEPGSTVRINGDEYELLQFHFHTPSEHMIEGYASAMELHLVHRNAVGQLAVVGVLIEAGSDNSAMNTIWDYIPEEEGSNSADGVTINAADFLPSDDAYFSYEGSLTTPPCSEGVRWNVLATPIQASDAQIEAFQDLYQVNARPTQEIHERIIEQHE